jgi:restriction endonuclease S subunit
MLAVPQGWTKQSMKNLVTPLIEKVRVVPSNEYKMVGVKWYGEGIFHRETVPGNKLSSKFLTPVIPNALIYNRLFAWKESFAVVPVNYSGFYVSTEFPQFKVNEDIILPLYLNLFLLNSVVINSIKRLSIGSSAVSRNRFKESEFLELTVPLPAIEVQEKIVDYWENARSEAFKLRKQAEDREREIWDIIAQELGIEKYSGEAVHGPFYIKFSEAERWDTFFFDREFQYILHKLRSTDAIPLANCAKFVTRRWKPADFPDGLFNYVQISDVDKIHGITGSSSIEVRKAPSRAAQLIKEGDLIISTTRPYLAAFAKVPATYDGAIASSGFSVIADTIADLDKDFLLLFLKSYPGLKQFEQRMTGGLYPAIVQTELEKILIPIPSLAQQRQLVDRINILTQDVHNMKISADRLLADTRIKLEGLITGKTKI